MFLLGIERIELDTCSWRNLKDILKLFRLQVAVKTPELHHEEKHKDENCSFELNKEIRTFINQQCFY